MAVELATGYVTLLPSARGFGPALSQQIGGPSAAAGEEAGRQAGEGVTRGATVGMSGLGKALAGITATIGAASFVKGSIEASRAYEAETRLVAAALKSTGDVAGVTSRQLTEMATSISEATGVSEKNVLQSEQMMLTFTNVRNAAGKNNDIFNQSITAATNLSASFGIDLASASRLVGKALNEPAVGLTSLNRVGVQFSASQKEQIKQMLASNNVMGAQKVILDELSVKFGGAAVAAADPAARMSAAWDHFKETVGTALLPMVNNLANLFVALAPILSSVVSTIAKIPTPVLAMLAGLLVFSKIATPINGVITLLRTLGPALGALLSPWTLVAVAAIAAVVLIIKYWGPITRFFERLWRDITSGVTRGWDAVVTFFTGLPAKIVAPFAMIGRAIAGFFERLPGQILGWLSKIPSLLLTAVKGYFNLLLDYFITWPLLAASYLIVGGIKVMEGLWHGLVAGAEIVWTFLLALPGRILSFYVNAYVWLFKTGIDLLVGLWNGIVAGAGVVWNFLSALPGRILSFLTAAPGWLVSTGIAVITGMFNGLVAAGGAVWGFVSAIPGRVIGALGDAGSWLLGAGRAVIEGLGKGLQAGFNAIVHWLGSLGSQIWDHIKAGLGPLGKFLSPKTQAGVDVGRGLGLGILYGVNDMLPKVAAAAAQVQEAIAIKPPALKPAALPATQRPAALTPALAGAGGMPVAVHFNGPVNVRSDDDITKLARALYQEWARGERGQGRQVSPR